MCGRAAQSRCAVDAAASLLGSSPPRTSPGGPKDAQGGDGSHGSGTDNMNMSPGMAALVFHRGDDSSGQKVQCTEKVWGLVPRGGTPRSPLAIGPSQHFSNLMFNARSDTLYDKPSFRNLALGGKTCVLAVDGFYEWKTPAKDSVSRGGGKQPYYVHRSDGLPVLIAGLWTAVPTGRKTGETLHTFTLLTTDACPKLRWLHSRMPVLIWDESLASQWINDPCRPLEQRISSVASQTDHPSMAWHPVTKQMSRSSYRGDDCTAPIKIDKVPSVKSFFGATQGNTLSTKGCPPVSLSSNASLAISGARKRKFVEPSRPTVGPTMSSPSRGAKKSKMSSLVASPTKSRTDSSRVGNKEITAFFSPKNKCT